ncbi:MAG: P-II family nitrogen regulator [Clostridiales bacterium]|nr:P-II family nitrogen regulator [Clostridiales bacterium]
MDSTDNLCYKLLVTVSNYGKGSFVLKTVRSDNIDGGIIFLGKGTARNKLLQFLELSDIRKEVVLMMGKDNDIDNAALHLHKALHMSSPNSAIAFSMRLSDFIAKDNSCENNTAKEEEYMYKSVFIVVDKGKGDDAVDIAVNAGAKGATIFNARGGSAAEAIKVFNIDIEPEKEVVLIVADNNLTKEIISAVNKELSIEQNGTGIVFTMNVDKVYGMIE